MEKEHLKVIIESLAKKPDNQPVGLGGKNPHTIKPPPPMPRYTVVQASVKRRSGVIGRNPPAPNPPPPMPQCSVVRVAAGSRFRLSSDPELRVVTVTDAFGKVIISGKKGKMVKITGIEKLK